MQADEGVQTSGAPVASITESRSTELLQCILTKLGELKDVLDVQSDQIGKHLAQLLLDVLHKQDVKSSGTLPSSAIETSQFSQSISHTARPKTVADSSSMFPAKAAEDGTRNEIAQTVIAPASAPIQLDIHTQLTERPTLSLEIPGVADAPTVESWALALEYEEIFPFERIPTDTSDVNGRSRGGDGDTSSTFMAESLLLL